MGVDGSTLGIGPIFVTGGRHHLIALIGWLLDFDDVGVARAEIAQFIAYWFGVASLLEEPLPFVIGRPSAVAPSYQPVMLLSVLDRSVMQ